MECARALIGARTILAPVRDGWWFFVDTVNVTNIAVKDYLRREALQFVALD